jgi:iron complex outermembrane recepter protein
MSGDNHAIFGFAGMAGVLVLTGVAGAQQAPAPAAGTGENTLTEIVVTAEKRPELLQDVPVAITVITAQQLANQHIYSIDDLSRTTPALEMVQAFGGPGGGGQIRGIGTNSFSQTAEGAVGIVVDGVPQGNVNITNLYDLQRVEVLKGPQGTLFGLTASAGVINIATAAPDPSKFMTSAHIDYSDDGKFGSKFGEETERAVLNAPISDTAAFRLAISNDRTKGVQVNNFNGTDNLSTEWGGRLRFLWNVTQDLTVNLSGDYDRRGQNYNDPQFNYVSANPALTAQLAACGITPSFENQARCSGQQNDLNYRNYGTSAQVDYNFGFATLTSITGYRKQIDAPNDFDAMGLGQTFAPFPPNPSLPLGAPPLTQIFQVGATSSGRQFSQEVHIASNGTQKIDYLGGLFYSNYSAETGFTPGGGFQVGIYPIQGLFVPFVQQAVADNTTNKSEAAFGQATYHLTDALGLIGGVRYTHQELTASSSANEFPNPPAGAPILPAFGSLTTDNWSGRVGLEYKINPDLTTYATAVRGYKGPQVTPAAEGSPQTVIGAEIPTAFEWGVKGNVLDHRLGWDGDLFYSRIKDYQGQSCSINPVGALVCVGQSVDKVVTKGLEFNVYGRVMTGWTINVGYIYDEATYPNGYLGYDPNNLSGGHTSLANDQLVGVPKNKITLSSLYVFPITASLEGFVNADTVYKSSMRLGPSGDPVFVYGPNWNTGARIGVRSPEDIWSVALFVRNLSNDNEPVTLFGGPSFTPPAPLPGGVGAGFVNGISGWQTVNSLRQVGITVEAKF